MLFCSVFFPAGIVISKANISNGQLSPFNTLLRQIQMELQGSYYGTYLNFKAADRVLFSKLFLKNEILSYTKVMLHIHHFWASILVGDCVRRAAALCLCFDVLVVSRQVWAGVGLLSPANESIQVRLRLHQT